MKFKPNNRGFYDVRRDPNLIALLEHHAKRIADEANAYLDHEEGYGTGSQQGKKGPSTTGGKGYQGRWRTSVFTKTWRAMQDNAENNTLVKALY